MDSQPSSTSTSTHADFLEQAMLAQAALANLFGYMGIEDSKRDDDVALLIINKAIKATVRFHYFIVIFFSNSSY